MGDRLNTKQKILEAATDLFGRYGFDGTSIRDIAKKAQVSLASVNYHFRSKHALYWAIIIDAHAAVSQDIEDIARACKDEHLDAFVSQVYAHLSTQGVQIRNTFRIIISDIREDEQNPDHLDLPDSCLMPPGFAAVAEKIQNAVGLPLNHDSLEWATRSLFTELLHWSVFMSQGSFLARAQKSGYDQDQVHLWLRLKARSLIDYLKTHAPNVYADL